MLTVFIDYIGTILFDYTLIFIAIFVIGIILYVIILKFFGYQNPILNFIIEKCGLYFLDRSDISVQLYKYIKSISNYERKLVLISGPSPFFGEIFDDPDTKGASIRAKISNNNAILYIDPSIFNDESQWSKLTKFLLCYRTAQPCNAFILTLSLTELLKQDQQYITNLSQRLEQFGADYVYPIYITFHDLDMTLGYESFVKSLSNKELDMVFGWSASDYIIEITPNNVDVLESLITDKIYTTISQFIDIKALQLDLQDAIIFPYQLSKQLKQVLPHVLLKLFYNENQYFMRGIYMVSQTSEGNAIFTKNLVFNIICSEDLSIPTSRYTSRISMLLRNGVILILTIMLLSIPVRYQQMINRSDKVNYALSGIERLLAKKVSNPAILLKEFISYVDTIMGKPMNAYLIPISWISNLNYKLTTLITKVYNKVVLQKIYTGFNENLTKLTKNQYKFQEVATNQQETFMSTEFIDLESFVSSILFLEKVEHAMKNLNKSSSISNIEYIVNKLFDVDLPRQYYQYANLYRKSTRYLTSDLESISAHRGELHGLLFAKATSFGLYLYSIHNLLSQIELLSNNLKNLKEKPGEYRGSDMINACNLVNTAIQHLTEPSLKWIYGNPFDGGERLQRLLDMIRDSDVLGPACADKVMDKINISINNLRSKLREMDLPLLGKLIDGSNLSEQVIYLASLLQDLITNKLVDNLNNTLKLNPDLSNIQNLSWNINRLTNISSVIMTYKSLLQSKLDIMTIDIRQYMQQALLGILAQKIETELSLSSEIAYNSTQLDQFLFDNRINNLVTASNYLFALLDFARQNNLIELSIKLRKVIHKQALQLLLDAYKFISEKNIYTLSPSFVLNSAVTDTTIGNFMKTNRDQLTKSITKVQPIIQMLDNLYKSDSDLIQNDMYLKWKAIDACINGSFDLDSFTQFLTQAMSCKTISDLTKVVNTTNPPTNAFLIERFQAALGVINIRKDQKFIEEVKQLYPQIKEQFDNNLKGYFPFDNLYSRDIPRANLHRFYAFWTSNKERIISIIEIAGSNADFKTKSWYDFLKQLVNSMQWIEHMVEPQKFPCSGMVQVRDLREMEKNVNYLSRWTILFKGENEYLFKENIVERKSTQIELNQNAILESLNQTGIDMAQKVASASKWRFVNSGDSDKTIFGFSYISQFSFLRFIMRYCYTSNDDIIYLKFTAPVINQDDGTTDQLVSIISIKLSNIKYTTFPTSAPDWNDIL